MEEQTATIAPKGFGLLIGTVDIGNINLPLYSNGDNLFVSNQKTYDEKGRYIGIAYHCVEFVRRFVYERYDINLADYWHDGDADDWYINRAAMPLEKIYHSLCQPGDIVTFTGEKTGHIAIVKEVLEEKIIIASQNLTISPLDLHTILDQEILSGRKPLIGQNDLHFYFESVMRVIEN